MLGKLLIVFLFLFNLAQSNDVFMGTIFNLRVRKI